MNFDGERQNRPSEIRLSGVPLYNAYKNSKNIDNQFGYHPVPFMNEMKNILLHSLLSDYLPRC